MARRRFEMHHYRQALLRMRQGDSDRDIAAARVMGRPKAAQWRLIATERGWLEASLPLPDDEAIARAAEGELRTILDMDGRVESTNRHSDTGLTALNVDVLVLVHLLVAPEN